MGRSTEVTSLPRILRSFQALAHGTERLAFRLLPGVSVELEGQTGEETGEGRMIWRGPKAWTGKERNAKL
jgi:hypothetical protein